MALPSSSASAKSTLAGAVFAAGITGIGTAAMAAIALSPATLTITVRRAMTMTPGSIIRSIFTSKYSRIVSTPYE